MSKNVKEKIVVDARNKKLRNAAVISVIVLAVILLLFNVILEQAFGNALEFDWTENKISTIGDTTKNILNENDKKINITVLATEENFGGSSAQTFNFLPKLLGEYRDMSKGKIDVRFIDPVQNPNVIEELDPEKVHNLQQHQIVVSNEDHSKIKVLTSNDLVETERQGYQMYISGYTAEEALTGSIKFVSSDNTPVVYVTTGHGEAKLDQNYTILRAMLERNNYLVKELNTTVDATIPEDATLLLMLNPTNDITVNETDSYLKYLKTGGGLYIMSDYSNTVFDNLNTLLNEFNLKLTNDRVKESVENTHSNNEYRFNAKISKNPLYPEDANIDFVVTENVRLITTADNNKDWIETHPVIETGKEAYAEKAGNPEDLSIPGVQNVAMYSINKGYMDDSVRKSARVAVYGSATMFSDKVLSQVMVNSGNYVLLYYSANKVAGIENLQGEKLLIKPKPVVSYNIVAKNQNSTKLAGFFTMIGIPAILLVIALIVYRRRRNL